MLLTLLPVRALAAQNLVPVGQVIGLQLYNDTVTVAEYSQIHTGKAAIRAQVGSGKAQEYSVEILKIYPQTRADCRNFLLKVTDPELLSTTGGIVQGVGVSYNKDNQENP